MDLVFLGTADFAVPTLRALHAGGHRLQGAVSQPDRPAGRGRRERPTPIRSAAEALGIQHIQAEDVNDAATLAALPAAELGVVVAFGQKLGPDLLRKFPRGCINLHGSLLPRYRGAAPYQWAVLNGDETTGVTIFQINERWDAGEIWSRAETTIGATETAAELHDRLAEIGATLMVDTLDKLAAGQLSPLPQDPGAVTRAPKLSKSMAGVDWHQPAFKVARWIHGLWNWPAAACEYVGQGGRRERVQLARAEVVEQTGAASGVALGVFREDLTVQCGEGAVRLLEVKPAGGKLMSFEDYARGRRVAPGDQLAGPTDS